MQECMHVWVCMPAGRHASRRQQRRHLAGHGNKDIPEAARFPSTSNPSKLLISSLRSPPVIIVYFESTQGT